jgi:tetratricopeptide (TPR) repeat protein
VGDYLGARFAGHAFPPELAPVINRRTEGNPLFMVSVVDDLVARGLIAVGDGRWELRSGLEEVEVSLPESLRQMIERGLEQLGADGQAILAAGSAAGMEFAAPSVAAALQRAVVDIEGACDALAQRQLFVRALGVREWPDGTVAARYGFMHSLHRTAVYQAISPARRRALHQAIGEREESGHGARAADIAGQLAAQFEQAGDHRRAVHYLARAAETAARRHANPEAIGYAGRALDLAERLPEAERVDARLGLLRQLGLARRAMGDVRASIDGFAALATCARDHGRVDEEARALLDLGGALGWIDRGRSLTVAEQALALAPRLSDQALRAHIVGSHGFQRILLHGWRDEDADACRGTIDAVRRAGERRHLSLHVGRYAYLQCHRAEYRAACESAEEGLRLALEVADAYHYMTCQFHRAWALLHLGAWADMRRVLHDGLEMAERNGHHLWARTFRFQTAWLHMHAGDSAGARALCERERPPDGDVQLGQFLGAIVLGFALLRSRKHAAAARAFESVTARSQDRPLLMDWILHMPLRLGLAECGLAQGDAPRAREHLEELCRLAAQSGERTYLGLARQTLAEMALAAGEVPAAASQLSEALQAIEGYEVPLAEWKVCATAARLEMARGRAQRAGDYWVRSAGVLDRLAASLDEAPDLQRLFLAEPEVQAVRRQASLTAASPDRPPRRAIARRPGRGQTPRGRESTA